MNRFIGLIFILFTFFDLVYAQNSNLIIKVYGVGECEGQLSIGLFTNPDTFPRMTDEDTGIYIPITSDSIFHRFSNLKSGTYALAIYHDENSNKTLDRSIFGWPTEKYVFSNYARGNFGPPKFEDASFYLQDSLVIVLYLK